MIGFQLQQESQQHAAFGAGKLFCWVKNETYIIYEGTTEDISTPFQIGSDSDWRKISSINSSVCGLKADGELYCWGSNLTGQLGNGMYGYEADIIIPTQIGKSDKWTDIYTGFGHACGIENGNHAGQQQVSVSSAMAKLGN